jgi:cytochrome c556
MTLARTVCLAAVIAGGCTKSSAEKAEPAESTAAPTMAVTTHGVGVDARTPLPLTAMMASHQKQEMRDHLRAVQEITVALSTDDWDAIAASTRRIGWSEQQAAMCKHMGAGAPGFAERGEQFHHTADTIAEAAKRRDHAGVEAALGATLETCTGCHEAYRQEIVDDATFAKTGGPAAADMDPSCAMMHGE